MEKPNSNVEPESVNAAPLRVQRPPKDLPETEVYSNPEIELIHEKGLEEKTHPKLSGNRKS